MIKKETIRDCFQLLEADYGKQTNQKRELWGKIFKKYNDKQLVNAVGEFLRIGKYFPRVSDIIEIIEGSQANESELAWLAFMDKLERIGSHQTVNFPEYPAIGAVVEAMGGWIRISDMKIDEEKWVKKEFVKLYPIMKRRGDYPDKLIGRFELDNSDKYTEKVMLEKYGRRLDGKKVDRKLIKGKKDNSSQSAVETINKRDGQRGK